MNRESGKKATPLSRKGYRVRFRSRTTGAPQVLRQPCGGIPRTAKCGRAQMFLAAVSTHKYANQRDNDQSQTHKQTLQRTTNDTHTWTLLSDRLAKLQACPFSHSCAETCCGCRCFASAVALPLCPVFLFDMVVVLGAFLCSRACKSSCCHGFHCCRVYASFLSHSLFSSTCHSSLQLTCGELAESWSSQRALSWPLVFLDAKCSCAVMVAAFGS